MQQIQALSCFILISFLPLTGLAQQNSSDLLEGDTWKQQGMNVISEWMNHGTDQSDGQFHAFMDREWNPYKKGKKYPGMLSRHLFSYSVAYMLSGKHQYLEEADTLFEYLINNGWDHEFGGWHYAINNKGKAVDAKKDLFMNIYAATGLSMYYSITHDKTALQYIDSTRSLLRNHAWDKEHGGYYRRLDRQWEVTNDNKVFTPQIAPVSGYLLYLYAATKKQKYLDQSQKLMTVASQQLQDNELGWIRENFNRNWRPQAKNKRNEHINIGHNIEVAWIWLRLYAMTGQNTYKQKAEQLYQQLHNHAFKSNGAWLHKMGLTKPDQHPQTSAWWIQAYGNMLQLSMYGYGDRNKSLDEFEKGSSFWNRAFVDEQYGGTVLSATLGGKIDRGDKAVRTKTSYHAMEHALLNYLYLSLWVENKPVELHFNWDENSNNQPLCPLPIYDSNAVISDIQPKEHSLTVTSEQDSCISIPENFNGSITVTIK